MDKQRLSFSALALDLALDLTLVGVLSFDIVDLVVVT